MSFRVRKVEFSLSPMNEFSGSGVKTSLISSLGVLTNKTALNLVIAHRTWLDLNTNLDPV